MLLSLTLLLMLSLLTPIWASPLGTNALPVLDWMQAARDRRSYPVMPCLPLEGRCRLIPKKTCVRACVNQDVKVVCRLDRAGAICHVFPVPGN